MTTSAAKSVIQARRYHPFHVAILRSGILRILNSPNLVCSRAYVEHHDSLDYMMVNLNQVALSSAVIFLHHGQS